MRRGLFGLVVVAIGILIAFLVGNPYFGWVIARVMGEQTVWFQNADGSRTTQVSGPDVPLPEWVPVMPEALRIKSGRVLEDQGRPSKSGDLELLSHDEAPAIVAWYARELAARGFTVAPPRPDAADLLRFTSAVEGEVMAANPALGVDVRVLVRSRQGLLLRPRLVELHWLDHPRAKP